MVLDKEKIEEYFEQVQDKENFDTILQEIQVCKYVNFVWLFKFFLGST